MSDIPTRKKRISKHYLRIIGNADLYYKNDILKEVKRGYIPRKEVTNRSILPTFTNDGKYFTSSFIIPSQKMESDQQLRQDHERRVIQLGTEIDQIYLPKPRSKSKYCGVCREHYQDYKEHIQSHSHINNLQESNYQGLIVKFCKRFHVEAKRQESQDGKNLELSTCQEHQGKALKNLLMKTAVKAHQ